MTAVTPLPRDANGQISAYANSAGAAAAVQLDTHGSVPALLYGPDGNPLLPAAVAPADNLAEPSATGLLLAQALGYDAVTAKLQRLRTRSNQTGDTGTGAATDLLGAVAVSRRVGFAQVFPPTAITDNAYHYSYSTWPQVDGMRNITFAVWTSLNEQVNVYLNLNGTSWLPGWPVSAGVSSFIFPVAGTNAGRAIYDPVLQGPFVCNSFGLSNNGLVINCPTAPTSGSVTVYAWWEYV